MPEAVVRGELRPLRNPSGLKLLLPAAHVITAKHRCPTRHIALAYPGLPSICYSTPLSVPPGAADPCFAASRVKQQRPAKGAPIRREATIGRRCTLLLRNGSVRFIIIVLRSGGVRRVISVEHMGPAHLP